MEGNRRFECHLDVFLEGLENNLKNGHNMRYFSRDFNALSSEFCVRILTVRGRSSIYCYYRTQINGG